MNISTSLLPLLDYPATVGAHMSVFGITGSGKTNTIYVIVEEILRAGGMVTIVDPEGDYGLLKNGFPILTAGKGRKGNIVDVVVPPAGAATLAVCLLDSRQSVVLDISGYDEYEQDEFVSQYVHTLWRIYQDEDMPPMRLIVDEIQQFAPQSGEPRASKKTLRDIARRGRKRSFALMVATQRPQEIDKTILDQTTIRFFHTMEPGRGLKAIDDLLPAKLGNAVAMVPELKQGEAIFKFGSEAAVVHVRASDTRYTQPVAPIPALPIAALGDDWMQDIRNIFRAPVAAEPDTKQSAEHFAMVAQDSSARKEITRLEAELRAARDEIVSLKAGNQLLELQLVAMPQPEQSFLLSASLSKSVEQSMLPLAELSLPDGPVRSQLAIRRAQSIQEKAFSRLVDSVKRLPGHQRRVLEVLLVHPGPVPIPRLALLAGLSESTLRKNPPGLLISLGLIKSIRSGRHIMSYLSVTNELLTKSYPDLNTADLETTLLGILSGKDRTG